MYQIQNVVLNYGDKPINTRLPSSQVPVFYLKEPATPVTDFSLTYVAVKKFNQHYLCGFHSWPIYQLEPGCLYHSTDIPIKAVVQPHPTLLTCPAMLVKNTMNFMWQVIVSAQPQ